ncbi:SDR family oxidoreductase [Paramicrobacterium chengjingii]|uniref:NAD(P)H-binding protein n=1 Tax=Paramicrobacterium chengjingii TaxID=2769067 RepID=A0ABX6YGM8_9MICO|nr:NAD(P)H-binding protein [Microbacterium chengjingii]QPZ37908.1 NAD(P)H-binding protein [Microbacterium chengjingii]
MSEILVTGGTGTLGVPTVNALRKGGHSVRVLSRQSGPEQVTGDLLTGAGLGDALSGVDTVVHLATSANAKDVDAAERLLDEAEHSGVTHIIYMSIVGIESIPLPYYRAKLDVERLLEASPVPHTILRATQFHDLLTMIFAYQKRLPWVFVPRFGAQPIAVDDVAVRLAELAAAEPAGRVADIGGPEKLSAEQMARQWKAAAHSTKRIVSIRLPGAIVRALRERKNMVPGPRYGTQTYADYLARRYG